MSNRTTQFALLLLVIIQAIGLCGCLFHALAHEHVGDEVHSMPVAHLHAAHAEDARPCDGVVVVQTDGQKPKDHLATLSLPLTLVGVQPSRPSMISWHQREPMNAAHARTAPLLI